MDHTDVALKAVVRALSDVVAPAVAAEAALATEQLRLAIDYLNFVTSRVDHLYERADFELGHHLRMARAVQRVLGDGPAATTLDGPIAHGAGLLHQHVPPIEELRRASASLAAAVSSVLRAAEDTDSPQRGPLNRAVATATMERVHFERAWYAPLGLDPDQHELPQLAELLDAAARA